MRFTSTKLANRMVSVGLLPKDRKQSAHIRARNFIQRGILPVERDEDDLRGTAHFDSETAAIAVLLLTLSDFGVDARILRHVSNSLRSGGELRGGKRPIERAVESCRQEVETTAFLILIPNPIHKFPTVSVEIDRAKAADEVAKILAADQASLGNPAAALCVDIVGVLGPFIGSLDSEGSSND